MSTRNFYNAMTPGSSLSEEMMFGKSAYKQITNSELNSNFIVNMNKLPVNGSNLLNAINEHGLLSYTDFHFLLLLMSTPTRYLDIIFHGFDISADGSVEAKVVLLRSQSMLSYSFSQEFVHVLARIANAKIDPDQLMREGASSGLVRYLINSWLYLYIHVCLCFIFIFAFLSLPCLYLCIISLTVSGQVSLWR